MHHEPKPRTILCIDDEPVAMDLRCDVLTKAGYRVIVASSAREGVRLFSVEEVDLVVLDYWMADVNGLAVARELKRINRAVPIVILSGYRPILDEQVGRADRWLIKGETGPEDLLSTIREVLKEPTGD